MQADRRVEQALQILLQIRLVFLLGDQLILGQLERAGVAIDAPTRRVGERGGPQNGAVLIDDRHVFRLEALDRAGDELGDPAYLLRVELRPGLGGDGDRRGRRLLRCRVERGFGRCDVDARRLDLAQARDRALQLALGRPLLGDLLLEVGHPEIGAVEELPTGAAAAHDVLAGELDALLGDILRRDQDRRPAIAQFVRDLRRVKFLQDGVGFVGR